MLLLPEIARSQRDRHEYLEQFDLEVIQQTNTSGIASRNFNSQYYASETFLGTRINANMKPSGLMYVVFNLISVWKCDCLFAPQGASRDTSKSHQK